MTPSAKSAIDRSPHARILVRATNWIGDTVMTMPAVQRLRELERDAHISLLCPAKLHDLWRHNPFLNEVIDELGDRRFDVAIIFPNSFRSAWECWRAGIPTRFGFAGHWRRRLLTHVVEETHSERAASKQLTVAGQTFTVKHFPVIRHQAHRYLDLISFLGGSRDLVQPRIWFAVEELSPLKKFVHDDGEPFIGINSGAEYGPAKRWPAERFAEVAKRVSEQLDCRWLLFGGPGDTAIAGQIEQALRGYNSDPDFVVNVAGKTSLLELCELIRFCRVLLTNDTGPMHLATAVGTPLVAIFGSTSPELTGPLGQHAMVINAEVECTPCFLRECPIDFRCMNSITVEQVTEAVLQQWNSAPATHRHA
jgi:heptosyltransferase-2